MDTANPATRFLTALFEPGDVVLFRPIETWTEGDKRCPRVDYAGITYHTVGLDVGRNGDGRKKRHRQHQHGQHHRRG